MDLIQNFVLNFLSIVWEALPFIILGAILAGILEELLPQQALAKLLPKHFLPAVMIGGALGLIFPMCECGIVVVMRRLLRKGLPLSCCVAYMLAGPIVNLIVLGSTWVAFFKHTAYVDENDVTGYSLGWPMVLLRAGLGYVIACITGFVVHRLEQKSKLADLLTPTTLPPKPKAALSLGMVSESGAAEEPKKTFRQRLNNISSTALNDFIDITVFLIIGSIIAALVKSDPTFIKGIEELSRTQPILALPVMMFLAIALCLCSEADAFLAASFKTMSVSAKLAFLVLGPMLDIKLSLMYTRVFKLKLILTIVSCVVVLTFLFTVAVHMLYNPKQVPGGTVVTAVEKVLVPPLPTPPATPTKP